MDFIDWTGRRCALPPVRPLTGRCRRYNAAIFCSCIFFCALEIRYTFCFLSESGRMNRRSLCACVWKIAQSHSRISESRVRNLPVCVRAPSDTMTTTTTPTARRRMCAPVWSGVVVVSCHRARARPWCGWLRYDMRFGIDFTHVHCCWYGESVKINLVCNTPVLSAPAKWHISISLIFVRAQVHTTFFSCTRAQSHRISLMLMRMMMMISACHNAPATNKLDTPKW